MIFEILCSTLETNLSSLYTFLNILLHKRHWCIMFLWFTKYSQWYADSGEFVNSISTWFVFLLTVSRLWSDKQRFPVWSYDNSGTESEFNIFLFFTHCTDWDQWRPGPEMRQSQRRQPSGGNCREIPSVSLSGGNCPRPSSSVTRRAACDVSRGRQILAP